MLALLCFLLPLQGCQQCVVSFYPVSLYSVGLCLCHFFTKQMDEVVHTVLKVARNSAGYTSRDRHKTVFRPSTQDANTGLFTSVARIRSAAPLVVCPQEITRFTELPVYFSFSWPSPIVVRIVVKLILL